MKKKIFFMLALLCTIVQGTRAQNYDVWDGTTTTQPSYSDHAIQINTAAQMAWLMKNYTAGSVYIPYSDGSGRGMWDTPRLYNISINADFDMTAANWARLIGHSGNSTEHYGVNGGYCFPVTCNGNGHTIKIKISDVNDNYQGLFYGIGEEATVKNLHVVADIHCAKSRLVGGIVGENNGTIENCWVSGTVRSDWKEPSSAYTAKVGGIAGENNGTIQYCCVTANVQNDDADVGGIVGDNSGHTISHCTFYGTRSSTHDQDNLYAGDSGTEDYCYGLYNSSEYDAASGKDLYRQAIRYTYAVNVTTVGPGTIRTWAADEYDVTRTYPNATFSLNVTSGTMARYTLTDADGNDVALQGHANDWSSFWFVMPKRDVTATVDFWGDWPKQGEGTEASPYLISSADDWNNFAQNVKLGRSYSGSHVKLTADISVSHMAGGYLADDNYQPFSGTFDGDGHTLTINLNNQSRFAAPFKCVKDATIKNLRTAGTIDGTGNADGKLLAGLAGICFSSATITNCRSSVTLTTNFGEDAAMAGIVAGTKGGSLTIEGCVFDGTMTGSTNTRCAGIAGYEYIATTTVISNTLFAPTTLTVSTADDSYTKTFTRDPDATITNCYYTQPLGAAQGTEAIFTSQAPSNIGTETADYGMVKAYENGLYFDGKYYFAPSTSTGAGTEGDPYIIGTTGQWDTFAAYVNNGNNYSGKFVRLTADISVSTMMGLRGDKPFSGTFLGGGHTITANIVSTTTGTGVNEQGVAPFHYIKDATIKNLKVAGTIASASYHTGGLVGFADGTNLIEDCLVTATLNISSNYAGGIIGHGLSSTTTIQGCAFTGTVNGVDGNRSNIGGLWGWSNSGTPTLEYCLEAGTYTNIASMHPMGLQKAAGTITGCYYVNSQIGSPQNACTVSGAKQAYTAATAPANLGNLVQNYGMVKAYANGILFDGKYYVAPATVTLADGSDNTETITGADGYVADVTLSGRTLYKDGAWNTICLPFNVTLDSSPLAGATARPLTSASISGTTLTLTFGDAVTTLEAGTPYIIKWASGDNIVSPVFSGVTIDSDMHPYDTAEESVTTDERVRFVGTYKSTAFNADDKSILLMGSENTLYYPTAGAGIGAQRAYFKIGSEGALLARRLTAFNIGFGDDEATGIISLTPDPSPKGEGSDYWYTLDGRRLNGKPSRAGVYINNGIKVVIK